jgi:hypothetical protein
MLVTAPRRSACAGAELAGGRARRKKNRRHAPPPAGKGGVERAATALPRGPDGTARRRTVFDAPPQVEAFVIPWCPE